MHDAKRGTGRRRDAHARAARRGRCGRLGVLAGLLLGCGGPVNAVESPGGEAEDYVGKDKQVALETLRFRDEAERTRFNKVHGCFAAKLGADGRHYPLRKIGNFVQEDWCRGDHSRNCAGGSFRGDRGDEWYALYTLHYDRDWPEVFGIGVGAGKLPREGEWGVSFSYTANGAQIIGTGVGMTFHRFAGEKVVQEVHLGHAYLYEVEETRIAVPAPGSPDEELARLIKSPEDFKSTALERFAALGAEVERQISSNLVRKCVYGEYEGNGIPPVCTPTALTSAERDEQLIKARAEIGARRAAVEQNAAELHRLLTELMAFDRCW